MRRPQGRAGAARRRAPIALAVLLLALVFGTFSRTVENDFTIYDDSEYLTQNAVVLKGLTWSGVRWAFTATVCNNWHPLTWLSHLSDVSLFGLSPGKHHLVSLLFHAANTVLLFLLLRGMTGALRRSAIVAAFFAVHPLHVESVAWAAERKDVLFLLFGLLTLAAYRRYARRPTAPRYLAVMLLFALGLMAKPMLVTLPFLLLLLDYWPLARWPRDLRGGGEPSPRAQAGRCILEKIPLLALAAVSSLITYRIQVASGAVSYGAQFPFSLKAGHAVVAFVKYLWMTICPRGLAVLYPFPERYPSGWTLAAAVLLLGAVSFLALRLRRRHPYLAVGWFWYLGTLVPVIGLVQAGVQALADRYTYLPLIGVFLLAAWGLASLGAGRPVVRILFSFLTICALVVAAFLAREQLGFWRDSVTLFGRAVAVTSGNWVAENNLGNALVYAGRVEEALPHYRASLRANPRNAEADYNLGYNLDTLGRTAEAIDHYRAAIASKPSFAPAHYNLGLILARSGRTEEAVGLYRTTLHIDPGLTDAHLALANTLAVRGELEEAAREFRTFLGRRPRSAPIYVKLGDVLYRLRRFREAKETYLRGLAVNPNLLRARQALDLPGIRELPDLPAQPHQP